MILITPSCLIGECGKSVPAGPMVTILKRAPHDEERSNGMKEWGSREHTGLRQVLAVGRITLQQYSSPRNVSGPAVWLVRPFSVDGQLKPAW